MANREARRRQKNKEKKVMTIETNDESFSHLIKIGSIVIIVIAIFYGLTVFLTSKLDKSDNTDDSNKTNATIQYEEILAGETFNMNNNEYYVMFYDFEDPTASVYETIISNYKTSHTDAIIYKVDLSKGFNQPYISETSNVNRQGSSYYMAGRGKATLESAAWLAAVSIGPAAKPAVRSTAPRADSPATASGTVAGLYRAAGTCWSDCPESPPGGRRARCPRTTSSCD
jgi:hypothetical protein